MLKVNKKLIIVLGIILIMTGVIIYYFYCNNTEDYIDYLYLQENIIVEENIESSEIKVDENIVKNQIVVHITGQVVNNGIVKLNEHSRVIDAIEAAGGATMDADLSKINLAFVLSDGQKVYIPSIHDEEIKEYIIDGFTEIVEQENESLEQNININTATIEQLQQLPGIGEAIAKRIINYRNSNGKFEKIEDLKNVSGIGEAKFNNIKEYIYVK